MSTNFYYINTNALYLEAVVNPSLVQANRLAVDSETYTLLKYESAKYAAGNLRTNPYTGAISLLTVVAENDLPFIFDLVCLEEEDYDPTLLGNLLKSRKYLVMQNAKFDVQMMTRHFGWINNSHCTLILAQLYANATGSKLWRSRGMSLGDLCRDWLGVTMTGKGSLQITQWYSDPSTRHLDNANWVTKLNYAAVDVLYLFKIHDILSMLVGSPLPDTPLLKAGPLAPTSYGWGMMKTMQLEFDLIPIVAKMELDGLPYSSFVEKKFETAIDLEHSRLGVEICGALGLELIVDGLFGDLTPSLNSKKVLNNPVRLCQLINSQTQLNLNNSQGAILRRAITVLEELARAENTSTEVELEFIEGEDEIFEQLANLSGAAMEHSFKLLKCIIDYKRLTKQKGMLLGPYANPETGKIHSRLDALRAATGRFACLAGSSRVSTPDGLIAIKDLKVTDEVFCYTEGEDPEIAIRPVLNVWNKGVLPTAKLFWNDQTTGEKGSIICTPDHLFLTRKNGWVPAQHLTFAQEVYALAWQDSYSYATFHEIEQIIPWQDTEVWDIEVKDFHNFIVEELCSHNSSKPNIQQIAARLDLPLEFTMEELSQLVDFV